MTEPSGLNPKREAFAREYIIDLNGKEAAIRAGYSERTAEVQASQLLSKLKVKAFIQKLKEQAAKRNDITMDWVLQRFKEISDRCMQANAVMVSNGHGGLEQKQDDQGNGVWEFDASGANKATEMLGKHIGFFEKDNKQLAPPPSVLIYIPDNKRNK